MASQVVRKEYLSNRRPHAFYVFGSICSLAPYSTNVGSESVFRCWLAHSKNSTNTSHHRCHYYCYHHLLPPFWNGRETSSFSHPCMVRYQLYFLQQAVNDYKDFMDGLWEGFGGNSVVWAGTRGPSEMTTPALCCGFCPGSVILQMHPFSTVLTLQWPCSLRLSSTKVIW